MSESLSELIARRLVELTQRRGGAVVSLHSAWEVLPPKQDGSPLVSYETIRRVSIGEHTNIGDETADAIAMMLGVPVDDVLAAAGQRVRLGRFTLPRRADKLEKKERRTVLAVVDAILDAAESKGGRDSGTSAEKIDEEPERSLGEAVDLEVDTDPSMRLPASSDETSP